MDTVRCEKDYEEEKHHNHYFDRDETNKFIDKRRIKPNYCHAYINNITFPKSLEELEQTMLDEYGMFDLETLLKYKQISWTAPRWAMAGDICFFMHAKTAGITISSLKTNLIKNRSAYSESDFNKLSTWLAHGKDLHKTFGGKIFAVARVIDSPISDTDRDFIHWKTPLYAEMGDIYSLKVPIDISEFKQYVTLSSRGAITPVYGLEYINLRRLIQEKNPNSPDYLQASIAADAETSKINNENWLHAGGAYRHSFIYEKQLQHYYVDYFLSEIGDIKTIYRECKCVKRGITDSSRVDNIIKFYGRYLPVEVKLTFPDEDTLIAQVKKYCNDDAVFLDKNEKRGLTSELLYHNHVLLIDRDQVRIYNDSTGTIHDLFYFDDLNNFSDLELFREKLSDVLLSEYKPIEIRKIYRHKFRNKK